MFLGESSSFRPYLTRIKKRSWYYNGSSSSLDFHKGINGIFECATLSPFERITCLDSSNRNDVVTGEHEHTQGLAGSQGPVPRRKRGHGSSSVPAGPSAARLRTPARDPEHQGRPGREPRPRTADRILQSGRSGRRLPGADNRTGELVAAASAARHRWKSQARQGEKSNRIFNHLFLFFQCERQIKASFR